MVPCSRLAVFALYTMIYFYIFSGFYCKFVNSVNPWFVRGGYFGRGIGGGVFFLDQAHGSFYDSGSFRIIYYDLILL